MLLQILVDAAAGTGGEGAGDSAYERGGEARRKFWIKLLKDTDLWSERGLSFSWPIKETMLNTNKWKTQWLLMMAKTLSSNAFTHK